MVEEGLHEPDPPRDANGSTELPKHVDGERRQAAKDCNAQKTSWISVSFVAWEWGDGDVGLATSPFEPALLCNLTMFLSGWPCPWPTQKKTYGCSFLTADPSE